MKIYITFGQDHIHKIGSTIFDKDTVACFEAPDSEIGRKHAISLFGRQWCWLYTDADWSNEKLEFFPSGIIYI
jgi:hypothetical protein